ncbi:hypothetical protein D7D52_12915 [Nocardia yunnanensis]|uniref:Uncharacterized protein n=1 Tax=Nocardia yunnanensis TaxID=2382165 RepID=A0A386ZBT3_9NOCA|nr:hypothetical protein [Nocardia yunnanensis]AYF74613.1 hypothetical protein D7D52_12915 [Nocardia yunnanensis]
MSHELAAPAAGAVRRTAQVLRYSAIVTASMASIGLTVAAGSYIANEMAHEPGRLATTPPAHHPAPVELGGGPADQPDLPAVEPRTDTVGLASLFTPRPPESAGWQAIPAHAPGAATTGAATADVTPRPLSGQFRLGTTYVGAQVAAAQHDSVSLTVDTNVFATLADVLLHTPLGEQLGIAGDPTANTQLRTDVDSHGDVTLTLSDPALGRYGVQIARHQVPAATHAV